MTQTGSSKLFKASSHFITITNCLKKRTQEETISRLTAFLPSYKSLSIACEKHKKKGLHYHIFIDCKKQWSFAKSKWKPIREWFQASNDDYKRWSKKTGITKDEWKTEKWRYCNNLVNNQFVESKGQSKGQVWVYNDGLSYESQQSASKSSLRPDAQILGDFIDGITLTQQYQQADLTRKAYIAKNWDVLLKMVNNHKRILKVITDQTPRFTKENFYPVKEAEEHDFKKFALVLHGPPEMGKTAYAKTLLPKHLRVTHPDKLKQFDDNIHDGIIFDDQAYGHWPRESVIHLMDIEEDADINVKNSMVTIPAGTPRIFITNRDVRHYDEYNNFVKDKSFIPDKINEEDRAIDRRFKLVHIAKDLRKINNAHKVFSS